MRDFLAAAAVALAISTVSMSSTAARAGYIHDDFDQGGPGTDHWLAGWSGDAEGWSGPWDGDDRALRYLGDYGLALQQPGYSNYGNDPAEGRMVPGTGLGFRRFAATVGGTIWFSALVEHTPNPNSPQDIVIGGRFNDPRSFFGIEGGPGFPSRTFVEFWIPGAVPFVRQSTIWGDLLGPGHPCPFCASPVHLLVAKLTFDADAQGDDAFRLWVDPTDLLNGEAGLGVPSVENSAFDVWRGLDELAVFLGPGNTMDAIRISYTDAAGPARLEQVLMPGCGNGTIDDGEQCDDGNLAAGDCCSPSCQFESAGTVCRSARDGCDLEERCSGTSATCPVDLKLPDVDGNGVCDCADDLLAATADHDGDGVLDLVDECPTTPAGSLVDKFGCSQAEFCAKIDLGARMGRTICRRADWRDDEIGRTAADCMVQRVGKTETCVARAK